MTAANPDPSQLLAQQFTGYFYEKFQSNREQLAPLFEETSTMTFEGACFKGREQIMAKLMSLPMNMQRILSTADCQALDNTFFIVFIVGQVKSDDDHPHGFAETFLLKNVNGQISIMNSFFRLILHNV
ncbi:nuclear transport factor 2-like [Antedon mediterranea]|uniref:nuclear transport factor 2-like n=1 Tax=Antedon mediterranea TaxID=105859 RepID=UPI003AF87EFB